MVMLHIYATNSAPNTNGCLTTAQQTALNDETWVSFLVPRKVRFLAMTMFNQARRCSFGLTKTFFPRSPKSAFSRHGNVRASSTLFIWLTKTFVGTRPCHTNPIEKDIAQATELRADVGQEERYLSPRPCHLPLTGVALIKMWLCG